MATPARQWKKKIDLNGVDLDLPSENTALCQPLDPTAFLTSGVIPDPLTGIITEAINSKKGIPPHKLKELSSDPDKLRSALQMFDLVLTACVLEPDIQMPPACDVVIDNEPCGRYNHEEIHKDTHKSDRHRYHQAPRDPEVLYADEVDMEDKMFIFQWALGGTKDLESFRQEQAKRMESLSNGQDLAGASKRPARSRK